MMSTVNKAALLLLMAAVVSIGAAPASSQARLDDFQQEVDRLSRELKGLESRYIDPSLLEQSYEVETRINDGRVFYLLKDYTRASIIFMDLVYRDDIRGTPAHRDSLFYLGDSLYLNNNYVGARRHFTDLLTIGAGSYYQDTVRRLIEVAIQTEDYDDVERLYQDARARGASPELIYIYGKSLFFRERFDEAVAVFRDVPDDNSGLYLQAQYFVGVIQARQATERKAEGRFNGAIGQFERVLERSRETNPELAELSRLALGRVYYEMEDYQRAISEYQEIPRQSTHFARSLFEMTWTYIKAEELKSAQRNLDILLLLEPDNALIPEAQLMRGDLQLRLGEYSDAVSAYQEVIDTYEPVKARLGEVIKRRDGATAYFDALVGRDVGAVNQINLPGIVEAWIADDPKMAKTLGVARDLEVTRRDIQESTEIIAELEDAINSRSKVDIFPELKEGWGRGLELESAIIGVRRELVDMEGEMLSGADGSYKAAREERLRLQKVYNTIPNSRAQLKDREKAVKQRYNDLEIQLFKIGYEIDSMRAQLVAMNKWIQDVKAESKDITPDEEAAVREGMAKQQELIEELEEERSRLRRIVRRAKAQTGINDEIAEREVEVKAAYKAALKREQQALKEQRGRLNANQRAQTQKIDAILTRCQSVEGQLETYFSRLDTIVNAKVAEIRAEVDREKVRVIAYTNELESYTGRSASLAGDVALSNFRRVEEKFDALILKADVGVIDVAWKRKEDRSNRIKELFELKGNDLKKLDKVFEDVRREN